jgi:hypothetical protein
VDTSPVAIGAALAFVALSCARSGAGSEAPHRQELTSLRFVSICASDGQNPTRRATARWPAIHVAGSLFSVADGKGYRATVRIAGDAIDCDDCPGPSTTADAVDGTLPAFACLEAVGPVSSPLRRASISPISHAAAYESHRVTDWALTDSADLDGDGLADLWAVERCAEVTRSGCHDSVCDRVCAGVRARGSPEVRFVECSRFVADAEDCLDGAGDADGDGIPDAEDQCPREPGAPSAPYGRPPCQDGCPFDTRMNCDRQKP